MLTELVCSVSAGWLSQVQFPQVEFDEVVGAEFFCDG